MQWDDSEQAGFTSGTPWKRVNPNYTEINVAAQDADPNSVLNHFRKMAKLRKENLVLVYGEYELILDDHEHIYAYTRTLENERILVLLNFSENVVSAKLPDGLEVTEVLINNYDSYPVEEGSVNLKPYQAAILR